jgi:betaine-aldehyde dehydrogenase
MAARGVAFAAFLNAGQVCTSAERIYVHETVHDAFRRPLHGRGKELC